MPIAKRPLDLALVLFFSISVLYGFLFSLPEGLGVPVAADSVWPPLRALHGWAVAEEPAHLDPPVSLIVSCLFDGLFQAPFLAVLIYALWAGKPWIRLPSMIYAGAAVTNMFYYFTQTFLGPDPPPNLGTYLVFNLPWLLAPMVLAVRMRSPEPFAAVGKPSG